MWTECTALSQLDKVQRNLFWQYTATPVPILNPQGREAEKIGQVYFREQTADSPEKIGEAT